MQKNIYFFLFELNRLCVSRYDTDVLYMDSEVQFSNYMGTRNSMKGAGKTLSMNYM